jgi:hypothetical protein
LQKKCCVQQFKPSRDDQRKGVGQASARMRPATITSRIRSLLVINKLPIDSAEAHLSTFVVASSGTNVVGVAGAEVYGQVDL